MGCWEVGAPSGSRLCREGNLGALFQHRLRPWPDSTGKWLSERNGVGVLQKRQGLNPLGVQRERRKGEVFASISLHPPSWNRPQSSLWSVCASPALQVLGFLPTPIRRCYQGSHTAPQLMHALAGLRLGLQAGLESLGTIWFLPSAYFVGVPRSVALKAKSRSLRGARGH